MKNVCVVCGSQRDTLAAYKYCSMGCQKIASSALRRERKRLMKEQEKEEKKPIHCKICGVLIPGAHGTRKYCADICAKEADKLNKRERDAAERERIAKFKLENPITEKTNICAHPECNEPVISKRSSAIYCGPKHKNLASREGVSNKKTRASQEKWFKDGNEIKYDPKKLGCKGCIHAKENSEAVLGWECMAAKVLSCKPWSPGYRIHYEPGVFSAKN